ncbi:hypothetical protein TNCV_4374361 [Trichonephila clavipes]|uniref:Uncharacterized protein n=1 Tax=Trichonephila clavipes TaxID=2585209 RepID=A0A8X6R3Y1_TRICX|nr:hypothetical protein TNCV_4374361 [Trichonephila clavipes]
MVPGTTLLKKLEFNHARVTTDREDSRIRCMAVVHRIASAAEIIAFVGIRVTQYNELPPGVTVWKAIFCDTLSGYSKNTPVVISRTLTTNLNVSLVVETVALPFMDSIQEDVF